MSVDLEELLIKIKFKKISDDLKLSSDPRIFFVNKVIYDALSTIIFKAYINRIPTRYGIYDPDSKQIYTFGYRIEINPAIKRQNKFNKIK
jgi:hypothetical protein